MNSPAVDMADYLVGSSSGIGLVIGTDLFVSLLPESPDVVVALFDSSGSSPDPHLIQNPMVQILVRGKQGKYSAAYTTAEEIVDTFHELANVDINSTSYLLFWKMTEINHVGNDTKGRPLFSCTMRIKRA
jgi:hypothetical protein